MDAKLLCESKGAEAYMAILSRRAFQEGYAAFMAGQSRTEIPGRFGVYAGNWVEGWEAASFDNKSSPGAARQVVQQDEVNIEKAIVLFVANSRHATAVN